MPAHCRSRAAALGAGVLSTPWWKTLLRPFLRGAVPLLSLAHAGAWSRDATPKLVESCRGLRLRVVDGAQCVRGPLGPSAHAVVVKGALFPGIFGGMPNMREDRCRLWGSVSLPVLPMPYNRQEC